MKKLSIFVAVILMLGLLVVPVLAGTSDGTSLSHIDNSIQLDSGTKFAQDTQAMTILKLGANYAIVKGELRQLKEEDGSMYEPFIYSGRTFVPIRFVSQCFGGTATWDSLNKMAIVVCNDIKLVFKQDSIEYYVQDTKKTMDVKVITKNGHIYVPVRYIAEGIGLRAYYSKGIVVIGSSDLSTANYDYALKVLSSKDPESVYTHSSIFGVDYYTPNEEWDSVVYNNVLYFIDRGHGSYKQVFKAPIKEDGTVDLAKATNLNTEMGCFNLSLYKNKLYFKTNRGIQCYDPSTDKLSMLGNVIAADMVVTNDGIYYIISHKDSVGTPNWVGDGIGLLKFDGTLTILSNTPGISKLSYGMGNLYYIQKTGTSNTIGVYNLTSKKSSIVFDGIKNVSLFNVVNDHLFMSNGSGGLSYNGDEIEWNKVLAVNINNPKEYKICDFYGTVFTTNNKLYMTRRRNTTPFDWEFELFKFDYYTESYEKITTINNAGVYNVASDGTILINHQGGIMQDLVAVTSMKL